MSDPPLLSALGLEAGYEPGLPIVKGASIEVCRGEIVVLLGPNGAGKSTLVKAIAGLVEKSAGTVRLDGADIGTLATFDLARNGLAFIPQSDNIFGTLTVRENLELAAAILPRRRRRAGIDAAFDIFPDLKDQAALRARRLSGGQRQMLATARGLLGEPKLMVLDEPSAGLSPKLTAEVLGRLQRVCAGGVAILLVEQNVRAALAIADRAYVLVDGRERLSGTGADLAGHRDLKALFLGDTTPPAGP